MMKKLTFALVSAFVLFAFASCNKENDLVSAAKISVDPTTLTFGVSGGATPVYLTANRDWTASVSGTGVTVSQDQHQMIRRQLPLMPRRMTARPEPPLSHSLAGTILRLPSM